MERDNRSSCLTGLKAVTIQAQSLAYYLAHSRDSINGSLSYSLVWPLNLWFGWLHFINQAYSQHHLIGPPDLKPPTSRCQGPQAKTLFHLHEAQHLTWMPLPRTISCPKCFHGLLWPLRNNEAQKDYGAYRNGGLQPSSICQASKGLPKHPADAPPLGICGGSWPPSAPAHRS